MEYIGIDVHASESQICMLTFSARLAILRATSFHRAGVWARTKGEGALRFESVETSCNPARHGRA